MQISDVSTGGKVEEKKCQGCEEAQATYESWLEKYSRFTFGAAIILLLFSAVMTVLAWVTGFAVWSVVGMSLITTFFVCVFVGLILCSLAGKWFVVFKRGGELHVHNDADWNNPTDVNILLLPTPGMIGAPSGRFLCVTDRCQQEEVKVVGVHISVVCKLFTSGCNLVKETPLHYVRVRYTDESRPATVDSLCVKTSSLLAQPKTFLLRNSPSRWLYDLDQANGQIQAAVLAMETLSQCVTADRRRSPVAADARAALDRIIGMVRADGFRHDSFHPTEFVGEIYSKLVESPNSSQKRTARS